MPGKCKFQDSWLSKTIYKDWLVKDVQDIHFARCRACCKSIKLQTMGEAALTSHAGGAGHKAAVRKLMEGRIAWIIKREYCFKSVQRDASNNLLWMRVILTVSVCSAGLIAGCGVVIGGRIGCNSLGVCRVEDICPTSSTTAPLAVWFSSTSSEMLSCTIRSLKTQ